MKWPRPLKSLAHRMARVVVREVVKEQQPMLLGIERQVQANALNISDIQRSLEGLSGSISDLSCSLSELQGCVNSLAGGVVELGGDRAELYGLTFRLDNPHIATSLKSRFLFNTYEAGALALLDNHLSPDLPVVEFGACIGVASCLANRKLHHPEKHVVVEAHPALIPTLQQNRDLNNCRFNIVHAALAYGCDRVEFWLHPTFFVGSSTKARSGSEPVTVDAVTLQSILNRFSFDRISLIVDVEGAEVELVQRELPILKQHVVTLMMEVHRRDWAAGRQAIKEMLTTLKDNGFVVVGRVGNDIVFSNQSLTSCDQEKAVSMETS